MKLKHRSGFTLLEIIIVIIIIGVLASLALPRLFSTVEFSRSAEALAAIATIRSSLERCYLQSNATYVGCNLTAAANTLDIENPASSPNAQFTYVVSNQSAVGYTVTASRVGDAASTITLTQNAAGILKSGAGSFKAIR